MDRDLIIQALKSACGNKNLRFQVIVQNSKLHIYLNRQADYILDYARVTDCVSNAIASLDFDDLQGIWLYSRPLGEVKPDWQVFVEFPLLIKTEEDSDTFATVNQTAESDSTDFDFGDFEFSEDDSMGDTGLLQNTGMIHGKPLEEEEIITFINIDKPSETDAPEPAVEVNALQKYCFVTNKKILTGDIIPPEKTIVRLVKFFHHLSDNNQQKILPLLDEYFKTGKTAETENLPIALQKFLKQITELEPDDRATVAIWLSRYCFNSSGTIEEFKAIAQRQLEKGEAAKKSKRSNTEYSFTPANTAATVSSVKDRVDHLAPRKFQLPPIVQQSIIPIMWTFFTVILVGLGVYTSNATVKSTAQQIPSLCQTTIGSPNYCRLGVNLAGEKAILTAAKNVFPMSDVTEEVADYGCQRYANVKAEALTNLDPKNNPVVSSYGEKIFPNIYVVEAVQKNAEQSGNVRVACVYTTGPGERSPTKLANDIIPNNWPDEYYKQPTASSNLAFGIYTNAINLALYTLFSAIGIAIASGFDLGIKVTKRPDTIYWVALILGIVQLIAVNLPLLNFIASIVLPIATILIVSQLMKNFKINWNYSHRLVVLGILVIIAVQFLLYGLSIKFINALII